MNKFDFLDRFHQQEKLDVDAVLLEEFAGQVGGEIVKTAAGSYLEVVSTFNANYRHGDTHLETILGSGAVNLEYFEINEPAQKIGVNEILFIDAETTGLSTATGTVAFLVGAGYLDDSVFKIHQFFLPDYPDEAAMLDALADLIGERRCLCTFNGKCFDLPLLETRYLMQKMPVPFADSLQIDLLHSSRRFWRGCFADTTLQTLEKELLGFYRYDDTPGYLIPQLYFDFLKSGQAKPLAGVLQHNRHDIISLLFLLQATQKYLDDAPRFNYYSPREALLISRYYYRRRDFTASCEVAAAQFGNRADEETTVKLGIHLAGLQKRMAAYEEALATYRRLSRARGEARLLALESAAKLLEHQFHDLAAAGKATLAALDYLDSSLANIPDDRILFWYETLKKRRQRLLRKLR
ncbi:MAG: ribonuclease H-like domain-containing protein [candidate division Zixibacteria bacterium]|nr:ribonuclease H-like domain-containing protein [candidate division Zixibacteria bacterium]